MNLMKVFGVLIGVHSLNARGIIIFAANFIEIHEDEIIYF